MDLEQQLVARQKAIAERLDELKKMRGEDQSAALTNELADVRAALAGLPAERERCIHWNRPCGP